MRKTKNTLRVVGRVYDLSKLELKKVKNESSKNFGQEYINGTLDIAVDRDCLNIVTVRFTYVTPTYNSGTTNRNWKVLNDLLDGGKTILKDGFDQATIVRIDGSIGINDFYPRNDTTQELVSAKVNEASFITILNRIEDKDMEATFECDMIINSTTLVEANEERNIKEDYLVVKGAIFDWRKAFLPISFNVKNKGGINFFEGLDASTKNLYFTKVWGSINNQTSVNRVEEASAFGEPVVKEYTRNIREYVITGTSTEDKMYEIGDAKTGITLDEIKQGVADREVHVAEIKKTAEEFSASRNVAPAVTATVTEDSFNF